jgi:S1-C subfamily serine protease
VRDSDDIAAAVNARRPRDELSIVVERGGDRRTLTVTLGTQPDQAKP